MPSTETPPNPAPVAPPPAEPGVAAPIKVQTRRFGEVDHTELVHLLDSLEGDQAKSRFRESIYISVIVYLLIAWFLIYGPRYLFHQGRIVPSAESIREKNRLTQLEMQNEIAKELAKPKFHQPVPKLDPRAMEQIHAMQKASEAAKAAPAPRPTPAPAPAPQQQAQTQPAPPPPPAPTPAPLPRPAAPPVSAIPDAPRPNLPSAPAPAAAPSQSIADAGRVSSAPRFGGSSGGAGVGAGRASRVGESGAGVGGAEILSDTHGFDLSDYIKKLLRMVKAAWLPLIPEECYPPLSKEGRTMVRFTIEKNGVVSDMQLDGPSGDRAIDKAAWGSITSVGQFAPLPAAYPNKNLELRITFIISRELAGTE